MKEYLGDGVYIATDGYNIVLTTENGINVQNTIYMEPEVIKAFFELLKRWDMLPK